MEETEKELAALAHRVAQAQYQQSERGKATRDRYNERRRQLYRERRAQGQPRADAKRAITAGV